MAYIAMFIVLVFAFYTVVFGIENWKEKNYLGSLAVISLALVDLILPFYMLFLKG